MLTDGDYTGVIDRFEDDLTVILLERDGDTVDDIAIPRAELPADARHQNAVLRVSVADGEIQQMTYEAEATDERAERAQSRFDQLSQRPSESEPDTNSEQ